MRSASELAVTNAPGTTQSIEGSDRTGSLGKGEPILSA